MRQQVGGAQRLVLAAAACSFLLAACGGGGSDSGAEGRLQVISFNYPGGGTLQSAPVTLTATASSGLPVKFQSGTPSTCTVSGDRLTLNSAGECLIVASQPGGVGADGVKWAAADETSHLFNVLKIPQSVLLPEGVLKGVGPEAVDLPATSVGGQPVTYTSLSTSVCTVSGQALTLIDKGVCRLDVSVPATDRYDALKATRLLFVDSTLPQIVALGGVSHFMILAAADDEGRTVTYSTNDPAICSVDGRSLVLQSKGTCELTASAAGVADRKLRVALDPAFLATGIQEVINNGSRSMQTMEKGAVTWKAGSSLDGWWCQGKGWQDASGAAIPDWCSTQVANGFSFGLNYDLKPNMPAAKTGWQPGAWFGGYLEFAAFAPGLSNFDGSGDTQGGLQVVDEKALWLSYFLNQELLDTGTKVKISLVLGHFNKKADGNGCNVTVGIQSQPTGLAGNYRLLLSDFAVTENCELPGLVKTDIGSPSAEAKAAALAELKAYNIIQAKFELSVGVNTTKASPAGVDLTSPDLTYSTRFGVAGPIAIQ